MARHSNTDRRVAGAPLVVLAEGVDPRRVIRILTVALPEYRSSCSPFRYPSTRAVILVHWSCHPGFISVTSAHFSARDHCFTAFSRDIALIIVGCSSYHTRRVMAYRLVNPGIIPSRCCHMRRTRFEVTPT